VADPKRKLIEYLPRILREIREFKAIAGAEQGEIDALWAALEQILDDTFITTAGEAGIARFERMLKITPKATDTLEERRNDLLARFAEFLPYTMRTLDNLMRSLCGEGRYEIDLRAAVYELDIFGTFRSEPNFKDIEHMLDGMIPANLIWKLRLLWRTWGIVRDEYATWADVLGLITWGDINGKHGSWGAVMADFGVWGKLFDKNTWDDIYGYIREDSNA
jgi:hypothetical protein